MEDKCRLAIERHHMLTKGDSVIAGLSGGADSCAMLHFLCSLRDEFRLNIIAVHVNHMIRGEEAERDAAFAERFCERLGVEIHLYQRDVPLIASQKGIGLEQCGREVRYEIFDQEARTCGGKIATAHTLSDSVETVIFHIIRGCSISGLKGIPPVRGNIIRPLILCQREDIEAYCAVHGIDYMTDSTNLADEYARNKIRLRILPLMKEINSSAAEAIGRLSDSARTDDDFLSGMADEIALEYIQSGKDDRLTTCAPSVMSRALIRICLDKLNISPEQKHILSMTECIGRGEGSVNLPGDHIFLFKKNHIVFTKKSESSRSVLHSINWRADFTPGEIITPFGQKIFSFLTDKNNYNTIVKKDDKSDRNIFENCLDYDKISKAEFRFRRDGDIFRRAGRNGSKTLKKLFNEEKLPAEIRGIIPMLDVDGVIAWICGVGVAEPFKVTGTTQRVLYINADLRDIIYQGGHFQ